MSHYKPYPAYKDSGVEWIGKVPEHWRIDRLKRSIVSCKNGIWGDEPQGDENDIPCVRVADFDRQQLTVALNDPTLRNVTEKERVGRVLNKGDLLLEKSGGGENQPVGCVVLYDDERPAVCSNFIARIQMSARMDSSYWRYVHAAAYAIRLTTVSINQTSGIQNLDQDRYFNERVTFPPFEEQQTIATALDRETARIDALIAKKTRFIGLLKEKRQALITHAVTKGLDPNVKLKDSGVEWIGEVPEHWITVQLGKLAIARCDGPFGSGLKSEHYQPEGVRVIRLQNIGCGSFKNQDSAFIAHDHWFDVLGGGHDVQPGDLLMAGLGDENNPLGRSCVAPDDLGDALVKADCYRFRINKSKALPAFLALSLSATARAECGFMATGATRDRLNLGLASVRVVALPQVEEQAKIVESIDQATTRIDALIGKTQHSIDLLKERRSAFITAAVTGQIDLREEA